MQFMVLVKANADSEAGKLPDEQLLSAMGAFNEEMVKAGVMLAGEGLQPTSKGTRVRLSNGSFTVTDGPFAETKELIAGFWIIQTTSREEAIAWMKRAPGGDGELELHQMFEGGPPTTFAPRDERKRRYVTIYSPAKTVKTMPSQEEMARMMAHIEEGVKSGVLLETGGLLPGVPPARITSTGTTKKVTDGPFSEAKEVIGGYAIIQSASKDEAIEVCKRFLEVAGDGVSEIRPVYELSDFPAGEAIDRHTQLRDRLARG